MKDVKGTLQDISGEKVDEERVDDDTITAKVDETGFPVDEDNMFEDN